MNRPIKFRIWDILNKRWEYDISINQNGLVLIRWGKDYAFEVISLTNFILQQFTGLLDKDGEEIYEGDIVKFDDIKIGGMAGIGEILYNTDMTLVGGPGFEMWVIKIISEYDKKHQSSSGVAPFPFNCEIVGNIFETPDLLK